jgi:hypothetical protein
VAELGRTLPLNQVLDVNTTVAEKLWLEGSEPPEEIDFHRDNAAISKNGLWLIRRLKLNELEASLVGTIKSPDQICLAAVAELSQLRKHGLSAISHGFATNHDGSGVFTVSPYIPDLIKCTSSDFREYVAPSLTNYLTEYQEDYKNDRSRLCFDDIYTSRQYSKLGQTSIPILLDVDPIMRVGGAWADQLASVMGLIANGDLY